MGIFRHSTVFVNRMEFGDADLDSGSWAIRPADGDNVRDDVQVFTMLVFVEQQGSGFVHVEALTSMGDGVWFVTTARRTTQHGDKKGWADELGGFGSFLKVRVRAQAAAGGPKPTFRAVVRLVSNGPYKAAPSPQQDIVEVVIEDGPDGGGGGA